MNRLVVFLLTIVLVAGCNKDDKELSPEEQMAVDQQLIRDFLNAEGLSSQITPSGLHYIIQEEGAGQHPTLDDTVELKYVGYLTNKRVFDRTSPATTAKFGLRTLIPGWQEGIPYFKAGGGKGMLLIPSALGYGRRGTQGIPPNSVIIFEITLIEIIS